MRKTGISYFITKTKCVHQLTADDIPPGLEPEDVAKECGIDCTREKFLEKEENKMKETEGLLLIDTYRALRRCEDAVQIELKDAKKNLVEWLRLTTDEKLIAKCLEICHSTISSETFELLVKEVGLRKAKKVLRHMHIEFQKSYYKRFIL